MDMKKPVGRPKVKERKQSETVSILPSKKKRILKRWDSLTKYLQDKMQEDGI